MEKIKQKIKGHLDKVLNYSVTNSIYYAPAVRSWLRRQDLKEVDKLSPPEFARLAWYEFGHLANTPRREA